jgi:DNA helicase II / ATP-dependent DNA helicase PcrA
VDDRGDPVAHRRTIRSSPAHTVVLYRTNAQSRALEEALRREGMPYRVVGGQRFYERREVKDVLGYLRLVANPADDEAFLRIVNVPKRGIGDTSVARLAEHAKARGTPPPPGGRGRGGDRGSARRRRAPAPGARRPRPQVRRARRAGDRARRGPANARSRDAACSRRCEEGPEGEDRIANVEELIAGAADLQARLDSDDPELALELEQEEGTPPARAVDLFLAHVALVTDIDQHDADADAVSLMTLHNAKGLEFPVVFLSGMEDGLFPLSRTWTSRSSWRRSAASSTWGSRAPSGSST